jgi:hypothetical protein
MEMFACHFNEVRFNGFAPNFINLSVCFTPTQRPKGANNKKTRLKTAGWR